MEPLSPTMLDFEDYGIFIKGFNIRPLQCVTGGGHSHIESDTMLKLLISSMLCALIVYTCGGDYSLKSFSNDRILMAILFYSSRVLAQNLLRGSSRRNIFSFCCRFQA